MSFLNGRVSFTAFRVSGSKIAPGDPAFLDTLRQHAFQEAACPSAGLVESGFTTGVHLMDVGFSPEKNSFGRFAHFALRIDTHAVPGEVRKAHELMLQQAFAAGNAFPRPSKKQKREAKEEAETQVQADARMGKFRRSKAVPLLWDQASDVLYVASSSGSVFEELAKRMKDAFEVNLQGLSAGVIAEDVARNLHADLDAIRPTPFSPPPAGAEQDKIPAVPWIAKAVSILDSLGDEFLLWLLHRSQTGPIENQATGQVIHATPWKMIDLDCAWGCTGRSAMRQGRGSWGEDVGGSPLKAPETMKGLAAGKWPRKLGMMLADVDHGFELALQGETLAISGGRLPKIKDVDTERGLFEARIDLIARMYHLVTAAYTVFLFERLGGQWPSKAAEIRQWICWHPSQEGAQTKIAGKKGDEKVSMTIHRDGRKIFDSASASK